MDINSICNNLAFTHSPVLPDCLQQQCFRETATNSFFIAYNVASDKELLISLKKLNGTIPFDFERGDEMFFNRHSRTCYLKISDDTFKKSSDFVKSALLNSTQHFEVVTRLDVVDLYFAGKVNVTKH